jgi:Ca2+-binding EF-hand superfamily protein
MSSISGISSSTTNYWSSISTAQREKKAQGAPEDLFAKVDSDGSGGVDETEFASMFTNMAQNAGSTDSSTDTSDLFSKFDTDGDGSLSEDELAQGMQSLMPPPSTMDFAQARGAEGAGGGGGGASSTTSYDPLDTNEDGVVSASERAAAYGSTDSTESTDPLAALFQAIDTDGDGEISKDEGQSFLDELNQQVAAASSSDQTSASSSSSSTNLIQLVQKAYQQLASTAAANSSSLYAVA